MQELMGKKVEVKTIETLYRGILVEVGETDVYLQTESGWLVIGVDRIVDIKAAT